MIINVDRSFLEINSIKKLNISKSPGPNFKIRQVNPPDDAKQGWDLADATWTTKEAIQFVKL